MAFFLLIVLLIISVDAKFCYSGEFNDAYLEKSSTTAINGIFVILIVFSHYTQYANFEGIYDTPYLALREHLNQMVVAPFLFYSGYGMMESIKKKGTQYVDKIPTKFWQLLLRFDIAVVLFLILNAVFKIHYPVKQVLLAFTTWTSIGNFNWYITAILMIYVCIYISFKIFYRSPSQKNEVICALLTCALTMACVFLQMKAGRPNYCYNTMIIAPLGMLYSHFKSNIEHLIMKGDLNYSLTLTIIGGVYIISFFHRWDNGIEGYTIWAASFIALLVLITMKVQIHNGLLEWFGKHVFSIYILQRLSMIVLDHFGCIESHKYISLVVVFLITAPIALIFENATAGIINKANKRTN